MIGRRRTQQRTRTTNIASQILLALSRMSIDRIEDVPHSIEEEIRFRPRRWLPGLIDVFSLQTLLTDYPTRYSEETDRINTQSLRRPVDGFPMYKEQVGRDTSLRYQDWDLNVTKSIEYLPSTVDHYNTLGLDMDNDTVSLTRFKKRLTVTIGICELMITQVRQTDQRPRVEFEIEVHRYPSNDPSRLYTDEEREQCITQALSVLDRIVRILRDLQDQVARWMGTQDWTGSFVGSLPSTYRNRDMSTIKSDRYFVQVKIDGMRYIVINYQKRLWYLSRDNGLSLSSQEALEDIDYMIDCELANSLLMAFDLLAIDQESLMTEPYSVRYNSLNQLIQDLGDRQEFLDVNPTLPVDQITELTDNIQLDTKMYDINGLTFETDGLIFQHDGPYVTGRDPNVFKWKFPDLLSIDFERSSDGLLIQTEKGLVRVINKTHRRDQVGTIAEYTYDSNESEWIEMREREDKTTPNFITTMMDVLESMIEHVTLDDILNQLVE